MKLKITIALCHFLSYLLIPIFACRKQKRKVLHISYLVHIAHFTVKILREYGTAADYLAIDGGDDERSDFSFRKSYGQISAKERWREFIFFWKVVAKYDIIHSHFMMTLSQTGWEINFFKRMGKKWVVHGRGCSERDQTSNNNLNLRYNICTTCDYNGRICKDPVNVARRSLTKIHADHKFVTTPDMLDFMSGGEHIPFFCPPGPLPAPAAPKAGIFKIVHVTNHPGIEGTAMIERALERLIAKGYRIEFVYLSKCKHEEVLRHYADAHLSIGKMKMGYYANAQIESLFYGVPAITYVRDEFITEELRNSGLIISNLGDLERDLQYYLDHPAALAEKRRIAQSSILKLHNNEKIARRYEMVYQSLFK